MVAFEGCSDISEDGRATVAGRGGGSADGSPHSGSQYSLYAGQCCADGGVVDRSGFRLRQFACSIEEKGVLTVVIITAMATVSIVLIQVGVLVLLMLLCLLH